MQSSAGLRLGNVKHGKPELKDYTGKYYIGFIWLYAETGMLVELIYQMKWSPVTSSAAPYSSQYVSLGSHRELRWWEPGKYKGCRSILRGGSIDVECTQYLEGRLAAKLLFLGMVLPFLSC